MQKGQPEERSWLSRCAAVWTNKGEYSVKAAQGYGEKLYGEVRHRAGIGEIRFKCVGIFKKYFLGEMRQGKGKNQYSYKHTSLKSFTYVGGAACKLDVLGNFSELMVLPVVL